MPTPVSTPPSEPRPDPELRPIRSLGSIVAASAPGILAGAAMGVFGLWLRDPDPRAETFFLAAEACIVLLLCGTALAGRRGAAPWLAASATACAVAAWTLLYGPHRAAVVGFVLATTIAATATDLARRKTLRPLDAIAWTGAVQVLVDPEALLALYSDLLATDPAPVIWTAAAAVLLGFGARWTGPGHALLAACIAASVPALIPGGPAPGWTLFSCLVLGILVGLLRLVRRTRRFQFLDDRRTRLSAAGLLAVAMIASAYPWMRAEPILGSGSWTSIGLTAGVLLFPWIFRRRFFPWFAAALAVGTTLAFPPEGQTLIDRRTETLSAARFRVEMPLAPEPVGTVILETDLVHGAGLPPETEVFRIFIDSEKVRMVKHPVFAGTDTDEWAAGRPDLATARGTPVEPWSRRVSSDGQFFRSTFRTVVRLDPPVVGRRLILRRSDALPEDVLIRTHRLETRP